MALQRVKVFNGLLYAAMFAFLVSTPATLLGWDLVWGVTLLLGLAFLTSAVVIRRQP